MGQTFSATRSWQAAFRQGSSMRDEFKLFTDWLATEQKKPEDVSLTVTYRGRPSDDDGCFAVMNLTQEVVPIHSLEEVWKDLEDDDEGRTLKQMRRVSDITVEWTIHDNALAMLFKMTFQNDLDK